MLRIQVIAEPICLMLALATPTKKVKSFDGKDEDHTKCLEVMFVTITNFKKES